MQVEKSTFLHPKKKSPTFPLTRQQMSQVSHLEKLAQSLNFDRVRKQNNDSNGFLYLRLTISIKTCEELLLKASALRRLYRHLERCLNGLTRNKLLVGRIIHTTKDEHSCVQLNLLNSLKGIES